MYAAASRLRTASHDISTGDEAAGLGSEAWQEIRACGDFLALGEGRQDEGRATRQLHIGGVVPAIAGVGITGPAGPAGLRPDLGARRQPGAEIAHYMGARPFAERGPHGRASCRESVV